MKRLSFSLLVLLLLAHCLKAAELHPSPCSCLFTAKDYGAHTQNFDILSDAQGRIYVANFEGLLRYDYARWEVFHTPNITRVVALKALPDGRIASFDYRGEAFVLDNDTLLPYQGELIMPEVNEFEEHSTTDPRGGVWAITDKGILYTAPTSAYYYLGQEQGLQGEVLSLLDTPEGLYIGTREGVWFCHDERIEVVSGVRSTCWQLVQVPDELGVIAATAKGLYRINGTEVKMHSSMHALSVCFDGYNTWIGELNRVRFFDYEKYAITREYPINNPNKLLLAKDKTLWIGTLSGACYYLLRGDTTLYKAPMEASLATEDGDIYLNGMDNSWVWDTKQQALVPQSMEEGDNECYMTLFSYSDPHGQNFISRADSKGLWVFANRKESTDYCQWCLPFESLYIRAVAMGRDYLAVGGDFGVYFLRTDSVRIRTEQPNVYLRSTLLKGNNFEAVFSSDHLPLPGHCLYACRIDDDDWSKLSEQTSYTEQNLPPGKHRFEVKCRDEFGVESNVVAHDFHIPYPIYLRWYAFVFYAFVAILLVQGFTRWRIARVRKENLRLESLVEERTAKLQEAQKQLARQEKIEMMGKLIQGLIDRILNPMNYILNFARLTSKLRKDMEEDIEGEHEHLTADTYDDMQDILEMMRGNLEKIEEHSSNTTRILKAMEELMHDHSGGERDTSLTELITTCGDLTRNYYRKDIEEMHMQVSFTTEQQPIRLHANTEMISISIMSMVANSFYSLRKKFAQKPFTPTLRINLTREGEWAVINIFDNGLGIEPAILHKIYDPFFTTKPTAEAPGVGLYLARDVIQAHHGDISCKSTQGECCEFTIKLKIVENKDSEL